MAMLCGGFLVLFLLVFMLAALVTWAATVIAGRADEEVLD